MGDAEKQPLLQNEASSDYATLAEANEGMFQSSFSLYILSRLKICCVVKKNTGNES